MGVAAAGHVISTGPSLLLRLESDGSVQGGAVQVQHNKGVQVEGSGFRVYNLGFRVTLDAS